MKKVVIIGGGLAGLSTAVYLSQKKYEISILEASPKIGGKVYSFLDKNTNTEIDNGQHILIGAYENTLDFLRKINSIQYLDFQQNLEVLFRDNKGREFQLSANGKLFHSFNLLAALLNYKKLCLTEKLRIIKFLIKNKTSNVDNNSSVYDYLIANGQTENSIKSFWEIITIGAMNTELKEGSTNLFSKMIYKMFFGKKGSANIILPNKSLNKVFNNPANALLEKQDVNISTSEKVINFEIENKKIKSIETSKRKIADFNYVVSAVPLEQLLKLIPNESNFINYEYSSIVSITIWLNENNFSKKFYALIDSSIHWVFNHDKYLSLVISAANEFNNIISEEIFNLSVQELEKYFPEFKQEQVKNYKVIKEKKATLKSTSEFENFRESFEHNLENLIVAGDWTNTNLPFTIESAILSGKIASERIN